MVSSKSVEDQLRRISYKRGWNRPETEELAAILLPEEEIFECVNGWYENGFALLTATNVRVLLIDKKPFNFLTIEDIRFDTISQIDYSHRMYNASICITTAGLKSMVFRSYNQPRLRKFISHVQHRMAELKRIEEAEKARSEGNIKEMDQQLRAYLLSQYEQHQSLRRQHEPSLPTSNWAQPEQLKSQSTELSPQVIVNESKHAKADLSRMVTGISSSELYEEGIKEIFGKYQSDAETNPVKTMVTVDNSRSLPLDHDEDTVYDMNPLRIAYSKLPLILTLKKRQSAFSA